MNEIVIPIARKGYVKKVDLQGLAEFNPKTSEYIIKIGRLSFPFKNPDEIFHYFLGKFKIGKKKLKFRVVE